jgi:TrmH family RNA methyltransferase
MLTQVHPDDYETLTARHPATRRVADVLRGAANLNQRTIVVDDAENIAAALRAGIRLDSLYVCDPADLPDDLDVPDDTPRYVVPADVGKSLFKAEKRTRVFALAHRPRPVRLDDLPTTGDLVVLDGVRLAGNIGAIVRTAVAFDAAGVVLIDSGLTTPLDRRLVRASRGLVFALPVLLADPDALLAHLARTVTPLVGMSAHAGQPLSDLASLPGPAAIVMGSERRGASSALDAHTTAWYRIDTNPQVESLNVSVATALALYTHRPVV